MLFPLVEASVARWRYADLKAALDGVGGCYGRYQTVMDAARDPLLVSNNPVFGTSTNPSGLAYPAAGSFATIPQLERGAPRPAPLLGADTDETLETLLGLSPGQIAALHDQGLIAQA